MPFRLPFSAAEILLPKTDARPWATVACDQFTSEPEYWRQAEQVAGDAPSCLKITLPEVWLGKSDTEERIEKINRTMKEYEAQGLFRVYPDALVFVERTLSDGRIRRGIVGKFDLDAYDYTPGTRPLIRPTEGTVLSRIPARVQIRKDAPLELPHVMILIDDRAKKVIEQLDVSGLEVLYDFDLMLGGGHLKGYLIPKAEQERIFAELTALAGGKEDALLFAVGDGNHSLASAKASVSAEYPESRYALAEIVNIHDPSLDFEPIYRVLFGVDPDDVITEAKKAFAAGGDRTVEYVSGAKSGSFSVNGLETDVLQKFLDRYVETHSGASVDYIHGEDSLRTLAQKSDAVGFLFRGISKEELFPYVQKNGPLPRKTFSMGEARDKRYYMEARRIK